jgi:hypothetical protein
MADFDLIAANSSLDALECLLEHHGAQSAVAQNIGYLRACVTDADHTINQLTRALRAEVEPPTFMGEPVTSVSPSEFPPLPTHAGRMPWEGLRFGKPGYTADQMRDYVLADRAARGMQEPTGGEA